jgi:hypothetical protein
VRFFGRQAATLMDSRRRQWMLFLTTAVHLGIDPRLKYISEGKPSLSGFFYVGLVGLVGPTVPNTNPGSRLLSFAKCNWRRKNRVAQSVIEHETNESTPCGLLAQFRQLCLWFQVSAPAFFLR